MNWKASQYECLCDLDEIRRDTKPTMRLNTLKEPYDTPGQPFDVTVLTADCTLKIDEVRQDAKTMVRLNTPRHKKMKSCGSFFFFFDNFYNQTCYTIFNNAK